MKKKKKVEKKYREGREMEKFFNKNALTPGRGVYPLKNAFCPVSISQSVIEI